VKAVFIISPSNTAFFSLRDEILFSCASLCFSVLVMSCLSCASDDSRLFISVLIKYLLNFADFWTIFSYTRIGTIFALIPIFYFNFKDLVSNVKEHGKKVIGVMSLSEVFNISGVLFITIATSLGFVTLVSALSELQAFFVLFLTIILSVFYPKILKEEVTRSTVLIKSIAIILMFVGVILIT